MHGAGRTAGGFAAAGHQVVQVDPRPPLVAGTQRPAQPAAVQRQQLGQRAALWGMENLGEWLAGERREILARRRAMVSGLNRLKGWRCLGAGAPLLDAAATLVRELPPMSVDEQEVLLKRCVIRYFRESERP